MKILGIETSCDETGAAVVEERLTSSNGLKILSNVVASSEEVHKKYGGIVPEQAARKQLEYMIPVLQESLAPVGKGNVDAIAVTIGPGLVGSLLVGVETAKTLAYIWEKPIVPVNHLLGHIYSSWLTDNPPKLPTICLVVSGGHTLLAYLQGHGNYQVLGQTRDDAAGEAFDKIARLLGFSYPGGAALAKAAEKGNPKIFNFPRPMINSETYEFSFSGLKTSVLRKVYPGKFNSGAEGPDLKDKQVIADLAASVQEAIVDVLVAKTINAVKEYKPRSLIIGGGVAANARLREQFKVQPACRRGRGSRLNVNIHIPPPKLCTDNGAFIAAAAYFNYKPTPWKETITQPGLGLKITAKLPKLV